MFTYIQTRKVSILFTFELVIRLHYIKHKFKMVPKRDVMATRVENSIFNFGVRNKSSVIPVYVGTCTLVFRP